MQDECIRLEVDAKLGRIVVASRSFSVGEQVMAEQPLLVFDSFEDASVKPEHNASYLRAFAEAEQCVQSSVLDMFHPPLHKDTQAVVVWRRIAREMDGIFGLSKELIHRVLMIRETNCHSYTGHKVAPCARPRRRSLISARRWHTRATPTFLTPRRLGAAASCTSPCARSARARC